MSHKVFTIAEMTAAEKAADAVGVSFSQMMEVAGRQVAEAVQERWNVDGRQVLVLVGPGNNGGDGLVAGRYLAQAGASVAFYLLKPRDAAEDVNFKQVQDMGLDILLAQFDQRYRLLRHRLRVTDTVIDALLGTGAGRPITGELAGLMEQVNQSIAERRRDDALQQRPSRIVPAHVPRLDTTPDPVPGMVAVDCPSGMNCDTGELDPLALPAHLTVTFAGAKRGHFRFPGAAACGELVVADIGIKTDLPEIVAVQTELATAFLARTLLPARPLDGHKGTFGTTLIAAGSAQYRGAPALAARGALRAGAGLVAMAVPQQIRSALAVQLPEIVYPPLPDTQELGQAGARFIRQSINSYRSVLIGPGLGAASAFINTFFNESLQDGPHLVIDADGLNLLAVDAGWPSRLPPRTILTPHPGEMARLMDRPLGEVRKLDRVELARDKAVAWGHIIVLKGAYTVVAEPEGEVTILPFANPVLATGGSGDVLAGLIAGLLAQDMEPYAAAVLGSYLHAAAGQLAAEYWGNAGVMVSEIADFVPSVRSSLQAMGPLS